MKFAFILTAAFCSLIATANAQSSISDNIAQTLIKGHVKKVAATTDQDQLVEVKPEAKTTEEKEIISGDSLLDRAEKTREDISTNSNNKENEVIKEKTVKKEPKKITQYHIQKGEEGIKVKEEKTTKTSPKKAEKKSKKIAKKSKVKKVKKAIKSRASTSKSVSGNNGIIKSQKIDS